MARRILLAFLCALACAAWLPELLRGSQRSTATPIVIPFAVDGVRVLTSVDTALFVCHPSSDDAPLHLEGVTVSSGSGANAVVLYQDELAHELASDPLFVALNAEIERLPEELTHREGRRYFAYADEPPYSMSDAIDRWRALDASLAAVRARYAAGAPRPFTELHFDLDLRRVFDELDAPGTERALTIEVRYRAAGGVSRSVALEHKLRRLAPFPGAPATLVGAQIHSGDLHVHSCHGEAVNACAPSADCAAETFQTSGSFTYAQLKPQFQALGLDWITATDHSYCINDDAEYQTIVDETAALTDGSFLAMPDIELSSEEEGAQSGGDTSNLLCLFGVQQNHMGAHGISTRKPGGSDAVIGFCNGVFGFSANIAAIRGEDGYPIVHHPSADAFGWNSISALTGQETNGMHGVEIWNGSVVSGQGGDVGAWVDWLLAGRILYAYSGSDTHDAAFDFGANHVLFNGEPFNIENLESAVKAGRLFISNGPSLILEVTLEGATLGMGTKQALSPTQSAAPLQIDTHYDFGAGSGIISVFRGYSGDPIETLLCQSGTLSGSGVFSCADTLNPTRQGWYRSYTEDAAAQVIAYTNPVFFVPVPEAWTAYGEGLGGANIATLSCDSAPYIGGTQRFEVSGFAPTTPSVSFLVERNQIPLGFPVFGGFLLVAPPLLASGVAPASGGAATLSAQIPPSPGLIGLNAFVQALAFSPNPFGNIGFSNGLAGTVAGF